MNSCVLKIMEVRTESFSNLCQITQRWSGGTWWEVKATDSSLSHPSFHAAIPSSSCPNQLHPTPLRAPLPTLLTRELPLTMTVCIVGLTIEMPVPTHSFAGAWTLALLEGVLGVFGCKYGNIWMKAINIWMFECVPHQDARIVKHPNIWTLNSRREEQQMISKHIEHWEEYSPNIWLLLDTRMLPWLVPLFPSIPPPYICGNHITVFPQQHPFASSRSGWRASYQGEECTVGHRQSRRPAVALPCHWPGMWTIRQLQFSTM